jgi:hypothetical protein
MSTHVMSTLRAAPFDLLWNENPLADIRYSARPVTHGDVAPADSLFYFSSEGVPLPDEQAPGVLYMCRVRKTVDVATVGYAGSPENSLDVQLIFSWPYSAPEQTRQVQNFYGKISRY